MIECLNKGKYTKLLSYLLVVLLIDLEVESPLHSTIKLYIETWWCMTSFALTSEKLSDDAPLLRCQSTKKDQFIHICRTLPKDSKKDSMPKEKRIVLQVSTHLNYLNQHRLGPKVHRKLRTIHGEVGIDSGHSLEFSITTYRISSHNPIAIPLQFSL